MTQAGRDPFEIVGAALANVGGDAWFVGGSVRDRLLGRPVVDLDVAVEGDPRACSKAVHGALGGDIFSLSDRFGTWRVNTPLGVHVDVTAIRGRSIEEDLGARDFTINAMAQPVGAKGLIDPFGGADDLGAGSLRMVSEQSLKDDPLRLLRLARLSVTLGLTIDQETRRAAEGCSALAGEPAPERSFAELRAIIGSQDAVEGVQLLDSLGLLTVLLPELVALQGVEQTRYHHKDAWGHTLEVLERIIEIERSRYAIFGERSDELAQLLAAPLADESTLADGLRWAALLHDIAKPVTRMEYDDGRIGFPAHEIHGAEMVRAICRRLHTSERFAQYVAALTRHHMRLGFLVPDRPLSGRAVHRYLTASEPVSVEVGVLSVADRLSTRGRKHEQSIPPHIELAIELTAAAIDLRKEPPEPLVRGDELAAALGISPGPAIGRLLAEIAEAQYAGEIDGADEAIALARTAL